MIKDIVKIHDKFSVEIKLIYEASLKKRVPKYDIITYLFVPTGLNINQQTYTKAKFYNDVKVNIRYNTPKYSLSDFISKEDSILNKLKELISDEINNHSNKENDKIYTQSKLFGSIFSSSLRLEIRKARKQISKNNSAELIKIKDNITCILKQFRNIVKNNNLNNKKTKLLLLYTDEFISNVVEHNFTMLHEYLKKSKKAKIDKQIFNIIIKLIKSEQDYRKKKKYTTVLKDSSNNEKLLYVRSQLKKYIDSVLFLKKEIRKDGALVEQTIFALVAGFAMFFSTTIAFYYQQKYGNFTLPFFIALVISYMMKDRIKSLVGYLFVHKANSIFYDYKLSIFSSEKTKIGIIKENFRFIPPKKLGPKVKKYRLKEHLFNIDYHIFGEQIIQYKKRIKIFKRRFKKGIDDKKLNSLADITRINFHRFIIQMDNPEKSYSIIENDKIIKKFGNRVYHINIIQKFYSEDGIEFKRYRVILTRNGINRIEKVQI